MHAQFFCSNTLFVNVFTLGSFTSPSLNPRRIKCQEYVITVWDIESVITMQRNSLILATVIFVLVFSHHVLVLQCKLCSLALKLIN